MLWQSTPPMGWHCLFRTLQHLVIFFDFIASLMSGEDTWCLQKILRIPYIRHTTNETVRDITCCSPVSEIVRAHCLRFFGHLAHTAPEEDHHRIIAAALRRRADWRRPPGVPDAQESPGWEQLTRTFSHWTLESTLHGGRLKVKKVKGRDVYIPPLTGKPRPAAVYNAKWHTDRQWH